MKNPCGYFVVAVLMVISIIITSPGCSSTGTGDNNISPSVNKTDNLSKTPDANNIAGMKPVIAASNVDIATAGAPDLIITDIWIEGPIIYYRVKNIGQVESAPTTSYLYVNKLLPPCGSTSFIEVLKTGEERALSFSGYSYSTGPTTSGPLIGRGDFGIWERYVLPTGKVEYVALKAINKQIQVCVDSKNEVTESNEANNCLDRLWGELLDYDLLALSHLATYNNGTSSVPALSPEGSPSGSIMKMSDGFLQMVPEQAPQGYVQGYWGYFYTFNSSSESAPIRIPAKAHLNTIVGLSNAAQGSDGVIFEVGLRTLSDNIYFVAGKKMITPGVFEDWDIDLSVYEGQIVYIILKVKAGISPSNDYAIWKDARLMQVN